MQKLKQYVDSGKVQIAKLDSNNLAKRIDYLQLQSYVKSNQNLAKHSISISNLSKEQKYQWASFKRLRGNQLYRIGQLDKAIEVYLSSLVGFDFTNESQQMKKLIKEQSMYPIILNIATCFYKKKELKKSITLLDKILVEHSHYPALYKKIQILIELGQYQQAKKLFPQINLLSTGIPDRLLDVSNIHQILKSAKMKQKQVYKKMLNQNQDDQNNTLLQNPEEQILFIKDGFWDKITDCFRKIKLKIFPKRQKVKKL